MSAIAIREVGPRDGLQNEAKVLSPSARAELVRRLRSAGVREIEATSFVRADRVPAMAQAEAVVAAAGESSGLSALVLNEKGYDRALASGIRDLHFAFPVTDTFASRNQNSTTAAGLALARRLVQRANEDQVRLDVGLICAFGCPFEGRVSTSAVLTLAERVMEVPPASLTIADTIGVGVPTQTRELVAGLLPFQVPIGVHLHDTRNTGIANAFAALEAGATMLDASVGGAGGCPFAPNATGNVATEDLVYLMQGIGVDTGISLEGLIEVAHWLELQLGRQLPSRLARAGARFPGE